MNNSSMGDLTFTHATPPEQIQQMWQDCDFVFDASALLNIYRYTPEAREALFSTLNSLSGRTWIPFKVMDEYHHKRLNAIKRQVGDANEIRKSLNNILGKIERGHPFMETGEMKEHLEAMKVSIDQSQAQYPNFEDPQDDVIFHWIENYFRNSIGAEWSQNKLDQYSREFERRFKAKQPPGYRDENKPTNQYGDVVIWFDLIDYARSRKKPIILVIDDEKEDWWLLGEGRAILGPRPELVTEMRQRAGVPFYMYKSHKFMEYAKDFLGANIDQELIDEIARQRSEDYIASQEPSVSVGFFSYANPPDVLGSWLATAMVGTAFLLGMGACWLSTLFPGFSTVRGTPLGTFIGMFVFFTVVVVSMIILFRFWMLPYLRAKEKKDKEHVIAPVEQKAQELEKR